jgi:hypothetical protein
MAAIALTIIILLNYLAFYYANGAFEVPSEQKKRDFFPAKNPLDARREVVTEELSLLTLAIKPRRFDAYFVS